MSAHASPTTAPAAVIRAPRHVRHVSRHAGCLGCGSNGIVFLANTVVGGKVDESQQHAFKIEKCHFPTGADGGLPPLSRTRAQHTLAASGRQLQCCQWLRHENRPARPRPDPIHCVYLDCVGDELFRTEGDAPGLTAWTGLTVRSRRLREYKYNLELAEAAAAPEPQVGCAATGTRDAWTSCKHCSPILLLRNLRAVRLVRPAASRAQAEPGHDNVVIAKRVGR